LIGEKWSDNRYVKIARSESSNDPGMRGVAMQPSFPIVSVKLYLKVCHVCDVCDVRFKIYFKFSKKIMNNTIIGYIHVCQKDGWKITYDLIMKKMKSTDLYDHVTELRVSVLSDDGIFIEDERFSDPKISIVYKGRSEEYERPTLLHIRKQSFIDPENTFYFYVHTKGIRHFGTEREPFVMDWIHLLLYWNIEKWEKAVSILSQNSYWTYGCNHTGIHYAGNFWWSKPSHIRRLSEHIPDYYTAPEDWVTMLYYGQVTVPIHSEYFSEFNSGFFGLEHYSNPYPESNYRNIEI